MSNSWPNGKRRAIHQDEHEAHNAKHYPGTRQLCQLCNSPTGRCEEDSMYSSDIHGNDVGPLCEDCYSSLV
jgi:hypothetical protein